MRLRLIREPSVNGATLGSLYVNFVWFSWTLEDEIREVPGVSVAAWKIRKETAIPSGLYQVTITESQRFKRRLPLVLDVAWFEGIRIHPGNTKADTDGCILPGRIRGSGEVGQSRDAFDALFARMERAHQIGQVISIDIENPPVDFLQKPDKSLRI
jgi:hypothetical protein